MNGHPFGAFFIQKLKKGSPLVLCLWVLITLLTAGCGSADSDRNTLLAQADSADALGRPDWVRFYLEKALVLEPQQPLALARLGQAHLAGFEGSVQKGIDALEKALELQPENVSVRHELAAAHLFQGRNDQAMKTLEPLSPTAATLVLRAEALMPTDPKTSLSFLEKAVALAPPGEKPYAKAAEATRILGQWQEMAHYAHLARKAQPWDPAPAYSEAFARGQLGEDEARSQIQEVFSVLKTYTKIQGDVGASAIQKLEQIKRLEPTWVGSDSSLASHKLYLEIRAGLKEQALQTWERVAPAFAMKLEEKHQLVVTLLQAGWYHKASLVMASLEPDQASAPNSVMLRAQLLLKQQRFEEMERLLTTQVDSGRALSPYFYWRGKARQWLEKEALAEADFQEAVRLAPWMATYRIALAETLLGAGQKEQAVLCLNDEMVKNDAAIQAFKQENGLESRP